MEALLKGGGPAAEIMRVYASDDAARGRNDPCTCGSGRKFKRCHGDVPSPSSAEIDATIRSLD